MTKENAVIVYHRADFDGVCSAAIASFTCDKTSFIGADYPDDQELLLGRIKEDMARIGADNVIMVDFSMSNEAMLELANTSKFTWIDHHDTAVDRICAIPEFMSKAKLVSVGRNECGACALAWGVFFPDQPIPVGVDLLSRYDVFDLDDDVLAFQYGLRSLAPLNPSDGVNWWKLICLEYPDRADSDVMGCGRPILGYIQMMDVKYGKTASTVKTDYGPMCIANVSLSNPSCIKSAYKPEHVAAAVYYRMSDGRWKYTVSRINGSDFNAGEFCGKFGGGGRKDVGGFVSDGLVF